MAVKLLFSGLPAMGLFVLSRLTAGGPATLRLGDMSPRTRRDGWDWGIFVMTVCACLASVTVSFSSLVVGIVGEIILSGGCT
jgi:hypothetical protein